MTRPAFGIVIQHCSLASVGELYLETVA